MSSAYERLFALDLGTTKFCLATIKFTKPAARIETISVNAQGMKRGMLSGFKDAERALSTLIDMAEEEFQQHIDEVVVGIAGSHLKGFYTQAVSSLSKQQVDGRALQLVAEKASHNHSGLGQYNLHSINVGHKVDERDWTQLAMDLSGKQLTGKFFNIEADKHYISDIVRLCNRCGLKVRQLYAEPYASSILNSSLEDRGSGLAVLDIGGGTTDAIVYYDKAPLKIFTINIGGILMTRDLSVGLGVSYESAENLKLKFGLLPSKQNQLLYLESLSGRKVEVSREQIFRIISARAIELAYLIRAQLQDCQHFLHRGVRVTGGGAHIQGLLQVFTKVLQLEVSCSQPQIPGDLLQGLQYDLSAKHSTVAGMLMLELQQRQEQDKELSPWADLWRKVMAWFKELS